MQPSLKRQKTAPVTSISSSFRDELDFVIYSPENESSLTIPEGNDYVSRPTAALNLVCSTEKLRCRVATSTTALVVWVDGIEELYECSSTMQIADATSELYEQIGFVAVTHGLQVVERRNDRYVYIANESTPASDAELSIERLLAGAVELYQRIPATEALRSCANVKLRMGIASGSAALLCAGREGVWNTTITLGVRGDALHTADAMAGLAAAGTVAVDGSALWRWAAAARSLPPPTSVVDCGDGERRRAAVFDLRALAFEHPPPPDAACGALERPRGEAGARRLRRSISYT